MKAEVYVNQDESLSDLQTLIKHSFLLYFPRELLMNFLRSIVKLINNSRGKYKRNTYLINICKSDTDFVLIYISFKFDFLRKYH